MIKIRIIGYVLSIVKTERNQAIICVIVGNGESRMYANSPYYKQGTEI